MLVEAALVAARAPGPLRAFYERIRARRNAQVAAVATARKLASLFWSLLTREQDYAYGQPSLARQKIRRLELTAGELMVAHRSGYGRRVAHRGPRFETPYAKQAESVTTPVKTARGARARGLDRLPRCGCGRRAWRRCGARGS